MQFANDVFQRFSQPVAQSGENFQGGFLSTIRPPGDDLGAQRIVSGQTCIGGPEAPRRNAVFQDAAAF